MTGAATDPGQEVFKIYDVSQRRLEGLSDHEERTLCKERRLRTREAGDMKDGEEERELCSLNFIISTQSSKPKRRLQDGTVVDAQSAQVAFNGAMV